MKRIATLLLPVISSIIIEPALAEPIPVRWKEMNMEDVNPAPYRWRGPCVYSELSTAGNVSLCIAYLTGLPNRPGVTSDTLSVDVRWYHKNPGDRKTCANSDSLHVGERKFPGSNVIFETATFVSKDASVWVRYYPDTRRANKEVLRRIATEIVHKFSFYAISCRQGGAASERPRTTQTERATPPAPDVPSAHAGGDMHMPKCDYLGVLGQRDLGSEHLRCEPTPAVAASGAYREQRPLPSVFPPGTEIVLLQAWAGSAAADTRDSETWVPFEKRHYGHLVANQMEYLFWELEMRYPREAHRQQFIIETVVYKDGKEFTRYKSQPKNIVPDESRVHGVGAGWDGGGFWTPGTYDFKFFVDGEPLASTQVQVK